MPAITLDLSDHHSGLRRVVVTIEGRPATANSAAYISISFHRSGGHFFECALRVPEANVFRDRVDAAIRAAMEGQRE